MGFLNVMFGVQVFERFSYYSLRSSITFLLLAMNFTVESTNYIYSMFVALYFFMPFVGSYFSDRVFGYRKMFEFGVIISVFGQLFLILSFLDPYFFFLGITCVAIGSAYLKSNQIVLVSEHYKSEHEKRTPAFQWLYAGGNIGAASGALACSFLQSFGWRYVYLATCLGVLGVAFIYIRFYDIFKDRVDKVFSKSVHLLFVLINLLMAALLTQVFLNTTFKQNFLPYFGIFALALFLRSFFKFKEFRKFFAIFGLLLITILLNILDIQFGSPLSIFVLHCVQNNFSGIQIPAIAASIINPITVVIVGVVLRFSKLSKSKYEFFKFILGLFIFSASFGILALGAHFPVLDKVPYMYLFVAIVVSGLGEIIVFSFLQSHITSLSPQSIKGFMASLYMLFGSLGTIFGVRLNSEFMSVTRIIDKRADPSGLIQAYRSDFFNIFFYSSLAFVLLAPMLYFIKRVCFPKK